MTLFSPQAKILIYTVFIILVFLSRTLVSDLLLFIPLLVVSFQVPLTRMKRGLIPIGIFVIFTFISNVLLQKGRVVFEIWGIIVTEEGVRAGGHLALRLFMLILGAKIITATTSAEELLRAMVGLMGPPGKWKPVREFVSTLSLTISFLPIIYDEARVLYRERVRKSSGRTFLDKIKLSASLLSPLFQRSMKRAHDLTDMRNGEQDSNDQS